VNVSSKHVGAAYAAAITALDSDRRARDAFRRLVLTLVPPGAALYDFGTGTGLDARFYAERGLAVGMYDADPEMAAYAAGHCQDLIAAGKVVLDRGSYADFLAGALTAERRVALITANFAPLSLIGELGPLFARLHALTSPDGQLLASVLSPCFVGDLRYRWWWTHVGRLLREGAFAVPGAHGSIIRRTVSEYARRCAPYFELIETYGGSMRVRAGPPRAWTAGAWLQTACCRYLFLRFRRRDPAHEVPGSQARAGRPKSGIRETSPCTSRPRSSS
jgi:SAM-dependent methyltransferase